MNLPQDPAMLYSLVNMKLRDEYESLDEFCASLGIDKGVLLDRLAASGFTYDQTHNRFV